MARWMAVVTRVVLARKKAREAAAMPTPAERSHEPRYRGFC